MADIFTDVGETLVADYVDGTASAPTNWFVAQGTGAGTAAKGDTTLFTEASESRVAATEAQPSANQNEFSATITADGVNLGTVSVGAFDLDKGDGSPAGVGATAVSEWLQDFGACPGVPFCARSDFDGSGGLGANDLSLLLVEFGASADNDPLCP